MDRMRHVSPFPAQPSFYARVTTRDGRVIEEAMAGATLLDEGARLDGVVIEATYATDQPPLLKRLGDDRVPRVFDPQTLRFVGGNFRETEALKRLPYAPDHPVTADSFDATQARKLTRGVLEFGQDRGADTHMVPGLPLFDRDLQTWLQHNAELLAAACAANGGADIDRRPLVMQIAPGAKALADPDAVIRMLLDHPVDGIYVQPLRLNPVKDSLEKLARFVQFLVTIQHAGIPVMAARIGAFGLVLQSLGICVFDSGLGMAESHDLAALNRPISEKERRRRAETGGGGHASRIYLEPVKTTLPAKAVRRVLQHEDLRHHFTCTLGCCRFKALEELVDSRRARSHYLHVRRIEVDRGKALPIPAMRLHEMEAQLRAARDLSSRVRRVIPDAGLPDFGHLDRWLGLLAREQNAAIAA